MSDQDQENFEKGEAGASHTYPQTAGTVKKGGYCMLKGFPCRVILPPPNASPISVGGGGRPHSHTNNCQVTGRDVSLILSLSYFSTGLNIYQIKNTIRSSILAHPRLESTAMPRLPSLERISSPTSNAKTPSQVLTTSRFPLLKKLNISY